MPCDTIRKVKVDLSKIGRIDVALLADALRELGLSSVTVNKANGTISGYGIAYAKGKLTITSSLSRVTEEQVCEAYSKQIIQSQCSRFGWAFTETTNDQKVQVRQ